MSGQEIKRGRSRQLMVLDSDSDVENQPPSSNTNATPASSPKEEIRVEMQRDENFDLSIFHREEDETSIPEKSAEIPDEEILNLPDIEKNSTNSTQTKIRRPTVLPRKPPVAVVSPMTQTPTPPRVACLTERPSHPTPPRVASLTDRPSHSTPPRSPRVGEILSYSTPRSALVGGTPSSSISRSTIVGRAPSQSTPLCLPSGEVTSPSVLHNCVAPRGGPSDLTSCLVHRNTTPQITMPALSMKPSTSKGTPHKHRKRQNSIAIYDSMTNCKLKKAKLDASNDSDTDSDDSNLELNDFNTEVNYPDTEPEMDSDEEADCTRANDIMPFPRLAEDINFDIRTMSKLPQYGFDLNRMGNKKYAEFLREKALTTECIEELFNSLKETLSEQTELPDPRGLTVRLMPHQKQGLKWMKWREKRKPSGGILADDMGLGKTLQIISLVLDEKNEKNQDNNEDDSDSDEEDWGFSKPNKIYDGKTLVVCVASLTRQWEKEVLTKCKRGQLRVYVYHGPDRQISEAKLAKYDIVITTYNLVMQEYELDVAPKRNKDSRIFKIHWQRVVLDEAHYIRNHKSKMSKAACELRSNIRWALTGTPIQNKEADFYALLKFLRCSPFDEWSVWRKWVSNRSSTGNQRLIVITKSLMLRRTKQELMAQELIQKLPDKQVSVIQVHLDKDERIAYQKLLLYSQSFFFEFLRQKKDKEHLKTFGCHMRPNLIAQEVPEKITKMLKLLMKHHTDIGTHYILVLILRLRQICCHPALIKAMLDQEELQAEGLDLSKQNLNPDLLAELNKMLSEDEDDDDDEDGFDIDASMAKKVMSHANPVFSNTRRSSKVKQVLKVVNSILDKGEKVIVVSQWTGFLKVIANNLRFIDGAYYATFSGGVNVKERQLILDRVNDPNDKLNVLLLSLTAGGVGLNLVGANNLLLIDLHWNPQLETQAQDRIYRFGQENNVHIYKFICVDTIEEKIKQLQDKKLQIAKLVLNGTVSNTLTMEDLKLLFS